MTVTSQTWKGLRPWVSSIACAFVISTSTAVPSQAQEAIGFTLWGKVLNRNASQTHYTGGIVKAFVENMEPRRTDVRSDGRFQFDLPPDWFHREIFLVTEGPGYTQVNTTSIRPSNQPSNSYNRYRKHIFVLPPEEMATFRLSQAEEALLDERFEEAWKMLKHARLQTPRANQYDFQIRLLEAWLSAADPAAAAVQSDLIADIDSWTARRHFRELSSERRYHFFKRFADILTKRVAESGMPAQVLESYSSRARVAYEAMIALQPGQVAGYGGLVTVNEATGRTSDNAALIGKLFMNGQVTLSTTETLSFLLRWLAATKVRTGLWPRDPKFETDADYVRAMKLEEDDVFCHWKGLLRGLASNRAHANALSDSRRQRYEEGLELAKLIAEDSDRECTVEMFAISAKAQKTNAPRRFPHEAMPADARSSRGHHRTPLYSAARSELPISTRLRRLWA